MRGYFQVAPEVVEELAHGGETLVPSELQGDGLEDLGAEGVVGDLLQLAVGWVFGEVCLVVVG